ncbi:MAG: tRNA (adenosine(37)-N6)-dimethylallyltransferase MiaA [candidate division WS1 bacterium]|jgi:tRNA dimethylallyltransferase|nr:tRNA (adenosine(37)-N6)-dimethylallyltransferase MiaA [candidate division WS1 bacterium]
MSGDGIPLLVIGGPTAAGKTELSLRVAEKVGGEVISADSMQIYRQMEIGTAKPTPQERARAPIHLIDFVPPDGEYTVAEFKQDAERLIGEINRRGRLPIVAGGTGLYLRALTEQFDFPPPPEDETVRARLWDEVEQCGSAAIYERLQQIDPAATEYIHPSDARRIVRALEVYELTGTPISAARGRGGTVDAPAPSPYNCARYVLTAPRETLFARIERRVDSMFEAGWVEEVRDLIASGVPSDAQSMQAIGYRRIAEYLRGERDLDETVALIKRDTRHYAKRQVTWLRGSEGYRWLSAGSEMQFRACAAMTVAASRMLVQGGGSHVGKAAGPGRLPQCHADGEEAR